MYDGQAVALVAEPTVSPVVATAGMTTVWKYLNSIGVWTTFTGSYGAISIDNTAGARKIKVNSTNQIDAGTFKIRVIFQLADTNINYVASDF